MGPCRWGGTGPGQGGCLLEVHGKPLYLLLSFAVDLKLLLKKQTLFLIKNHLSTNFVVDTDTPHKSFFRTEGLFPQLLGVTEDGPPGADAQELPQLNEESLPQGHVTVLVDTEE